MFITFHFFLQIGLILMVLFEIMENMTIYDDQLKLYNKLCPNKNKCANKSHHIICRYAKNPRLDCKINCHPKTEKEVNEILDAVNELRRKIVSGELEGKDGLLPKGYGMIRLQWCSELAMLTKVLVESCYTDTQTDRCIITDRYPNVALISKWSLKQQPGDINEFLTKYGYDKINQLTEKDINTAGASVNTHANQILVSLIQSSATHIGCCMTSYFWSSQTQGSVHCYLADMKRKELYNTTPPVRGRGFSSVCGCPLGFTEGDDCLCDKYPYITTSTEPAMYPPNYPYKRVRGPPELFTYIPKPEELISRPASSGTMVTKECTGPIRKCSPKIVMVPVLNLRRVNGKLVFPEVNPLLDINSLVAKAMLATNNFVLNSNFKTNKPIVLDAKLTTIINKPDADSPADYLIPIENSMYDHKGHVPDTELIFGFDTNKLSSTKTTFSTTNSMYKDEKHMPDTEVIYDYLIPEANNPTQTDVSIYDIKKHVPHEVINEYDTNVQLQTTETTLKIVANSNPGLIEGYDPDQVLYKFDQLSPGAKITPENNYDFDDSDITFYDIMESHKRN